MKRVVGLLGLGLAVLMVLLAGCQNGELDSAAPAPTSEPAQLTVHDSGIFFEKTTTPAGSLLRYTISVPPGYDAANPVPLVVALHYGGEVTPHYGFGLIESLVEPGFRDLGAIIVAPDALGGDDWTSSKNEQAVGWLTRSIMASYAVDPEKVLLTGYSMGGEGAWYIGSRHQDLFTAVVPVEGDPAGGRVEWKIPIYVIHSWDDEVIPIGPVQAHVKQLAEQGAMVKLEAVTGLTHYDTPAYSGLLQEAVPWLLAIWPE